MSNRPAPTPAPAATSASRFPRLATRLARPAASAALAAAALLLAAPGIGHAADWPMWGGSPERNMAATATGLPADFDPGRFLPDSEKVDPATAKQLKWVAKLGSQAYGAPVVANGHILVGTNNEAPRNPDRQGDYGVLMCLDEKTGELKWQLTVPKLGAGKVSDWEYLGICSSPAVVGDRVYVITNRCEVVCLDLKGLANGNDGVQDEAVYFGDGKPVTLSPQDADVIWRIDMRDEVGVFPHNITSSSPLVVGDRVYCTTSNGQDWSHLNIPSPKAPTLIALDAATGELIAEEGSGISTRLFHCNWSSPAWAADAPGGAMVVFGAGDGYLYGFDPTPKMGDDGFMILPERFRFNCNPRDHIVDADGEPRKYPSANGKSECIATPVVIGNRAFIAVGQDPEHGEGVGALSCVDISKTGDISESGKVWQFTGMNRSISTVAVANGLLFAADYSGMLYCLDPDTGTLYWSHDTGSHIWSSPVIADGKVYLGDEDGQLMVFKADKAKTLLRTIEFPASIHSAPVVANGVLYVATMSHLYAFAAD